MVQQCLAKQDKDKIGLWSTMDLEITLDIREWDKHNMREVVAIFLLLGIAIVESGNIGTLKILCLKIFHIKDSYLRVHLKCH
jgi:hypothetical protein